MPKNRNETGRTYEEGTVKHGDKVKKVLREGAERQAVGIPDLEAEGYPTPGA